jgi:copper chaperone CopZ
VFLATHLLAQQKNESTIDIMTSAICEMCKNTIEYELIYEKGVKDARLDLDSKWVTVTYNPQKTNPEAIRQRISLTGYHADSIQRDPEAYQKLPFCCRDGGHDEH